MRRFERRSKLTHRRIRIGQPQGCALARSASDDAHLAGSWPGRPSLTFQSLSAPLLACPPIVIGDLRRQPTPRGHASDVAVRGSRLDASSHLKVGSRLAPEAGRGCIAAPRPWLLPALAPGAWPGSPRPRCVTRWGGCPPRSGSALRRFTAAVLRLRRRGGAFVRRASRPPVRWVGSCETHLTGDRSCSIHTNRCSSP